MRKKRENQGYTCPLPFLLLTPPNTHRNPNKIICELCLEVEEERKRSRLHILYSHIFISCIFIGVPRLYHFYYKDLRGREWPRLLNLCGKNGRITRTPKIQEIIRCKIRKLNMKKTPWKIGPSSIFSIFHCLFLSFLILRISYYLLQNAGLFGIIRYT